jgi:hypothetical protein
VEDTFVEKYVCAAHQEHNCVLGSVYTFQFLGNIPISYAKVPQYSFIIFEMFHRKLEIFSQKVNMRTLFRVSQKIYKNDT